MVKADVKHNYYADLELAPTASLEDVRKAYRKLALQWHPDRNAGREDECVPKFQAIQAANEVLGDAAVKQKYDLDRRKAGLFATAPSYNPRQPAPGNPYAANSAYPPPPRRTQPGVYQRTGPAPSGMSAGGAASGADRFSNFPRGAPTARKDAGPDKANQARAFNAAFGPGAGQPRGPPPAQPPPAQHSRPRPQPPPRQETKMPTEEQIRAGMKHRNVPRFDQETVDRNQAAWQSWSQQQKAPGPGPGPVPPRPNVPRNESMRTPNRHGFNPSQPGSDEKPSASHYMHKNRSAEFPRPQMPGVRVPPPPAGPPPSNGATPTAQSPVSPTSQRPFGSRPTSSRTPNDQVPYFEGNRNRTPYTSYIHEKTDLGDGLKRSASVRDTTKLDPNDGTPRGRARSTSPLGRQRASDSHVNGSNQQKPFVVYSDSEESSTKTNGSSDDMDELHRSRTEPNEKGPFGRPKKAPTPRNRPTTGNGTAQSDNEQPAMQQKASANMYEPPFPLESSPSFASSQHSRLRSTRTARRTWSTAGNWAIPSSVNPSVKSKSVKKPIIRSQHSHSPLEFVTGADKVFTFAREDEQNAYLRFQTDLQIEYGDVPGNLDMDVFLKLASTARKGLSCGRARLDSVLKRLCADFPLVGVSQSNHADQKGEHSFHFPHTDRLFTPNNAKSRSEENINTSFSPEGWSGEFTGEPDYFAPPMSSGRKQPSPVPRGARTPRDQTRAATMDVPTGNGQSEEAPSRPWGSDGTPKATPPIPTPGEVKFSKEGWEQTFKDASWTWNPPTARQTSPVKGGAAASARKPSQARKASRATGTGFSGQQPSQATDGTTGPDAVGGNAEGTGPLDDGDAMDIDDSPPANANSAESQTSTSDKARLYSVPPSTWRQQQEQKQNPNPSYRKSVNNSSSSNNNNNNGTALNTNLDDLRNVEPIAKTAPGTTGLSNFTGMSTTLPFPSAASNSAPTTATTPTGPHPSLPPNPKLPPEPPRLSRTTWQSYSAAFGAYCIAFHTFSRAMLSHFEAAEKRAQDRFAMGCGWMEQAGDTSGVTGGQMGFASYAAETLALERAREGWGVGCERHAEGVRGFERVRERVRRLAEGGMLPEV